MIDLFLMDGIGGKGGPGAMLGNLAKPLVQSGKYEVHDVLYKASIGPVNPEQNLFNNVWLKESSIDGARKLAEAIHRTDRLAAIGGYSGGADAVSQLLEDMRKGEPYTRGLQILWAVTVANPRRAHDPLRRKWGYGVAGEHKPFPSFMTVEHYEIANATDAIPCCPEFSPLRNITDLGQEGFNLHAWADRLARDGFQQPLPSMPTRWSDPKFWFNPGAFEKAIQDAREQQYIWRLTRDAYLSAPHSLRLYLEGSAHGSDYTKFRLFDPVVDDILRRF